MSTLARFASTSVLTCSADDLLGDSLQRMINATVSSIVIVEGHRPVGIVTEWRAVYALRSGVSLSSRIGDLQDCDPVSIPVTAKVADAYAMMRLHGRKHLILVDAEGLLFGVVAWREIWLALESGHGDTGWGTRNASVTAPFVKPTHATLKPIDTLSDAIMLMASRHTNYVFVLYLRFPVGILTARMVLRLSLSGVGPDVPLRRIMSTPVIFSHTSSAITAGELLATSETRHLAVVDGEGELIGVVTRGSLLHARYVPHAGMTPSQLQPVVSSPRDRYLDAIEAVGQGVFDWDLWRDEMSVTEAWKASLGYGEMDTDVAFTSWRDRVHPDDVEVALGAVQEHLRGETDTFRAVYRAKRQDGSYQWTMAMGVVSKRGPDGEPIHMTGTLTNVSVEQERFVRLRRAHAQLEAMFDNLPFAAWFKNAEGRLLASNRAFLDVFNMKSHADAIGLTDHDFWPKHVADRHQESDRDVMRSGRSVRVLERTESDHEVHWSEIIKSPVRLLNGEVVGTVGVVHDVTEKQELDIALRAEQWRLQRILDTTDMLVVSVDTAGRVMQVNRALCRLLGRKESEMTGGPWFEIAKPRPIGGGEASAVFEGLKGTKFEGAATREVELLTASGERRRVTWKVNQLRDQAGEMVGLLNTGLDVTQQRAREARLKLAESRLKTFAHFDPLTALPNRTLLIDRIEQAIVRVQRAGGLVAVAVLDLDHFKQINGRLGHAAGDEVLVEVANRIRNTLREANTVARIGGDEFAILLSDQTDMASCEAIFGRVLAAIARPIDVAPELVGLAASLGYSLYPEDMQDAGTLLRHAGHAMHDAKRAGRNTLLRYDQAADREVLAKRTFTSRVIAAMEGGEFELFYQPKVDLRRGTVEGFEALIRWRDPERGILLPSAFLPRLETHTLAITLDHWVIGEALRQLDVWIAAGIDLPVSVNVAPNTLTDASFVEELERKLAEHPAIPAGTVEIEVLETTALEGVDRVRATLAACRERGVRIALDDFGTGYSSLTLFRRLPSDIVKIDRTFVRDMLADPEDLSIVESVVGLATAFRRKIIAEGVEDVAQGRALAAMGCDVVQGFGVARPMPAQDVPGWLAGFELPAVWRV